MSDGLEIVMDDETREALEMTKDEREARWNAGKPAKVRKSEDFVERMKRVVDESTADDDAAEIVTEPFEYDAADAFVGADPPKRVYKDEDLSAEVKKIPLPA